LADALTLDATALASAWAALPAAERAALETQAAAWVRADQRANAVVYYRVVNPAARLVHGSTAREVGVQGGNKSGKTGTLLAELAIQLTKIVPDSLAGVYPRGKLKPGPVRARLVVTSLSSAWDTNLKLKLQFWEWNGRPNGAGLLGDPDVGHYGWIPQRCLIRGDWAASWSEKHRVLTLADGSTLQVMSHDQDLQEFNQGAFDLIVEDEIPPEAIHRANRLRVMERGGQILTGGTPSDDRAQAAVSHAWFFDQILEPGLARSAPADVEACVLWTEHNRTLDPANVEYVAAGLTAEQRRARLHGDAIHLGGLIFPTFTITPKVWCFTCGDQTRDRGGHCAECGSTKLTGYSHVWDEGDLPWPGPTEWPVVFYMDPHQARATVCAWYKVDPLDQWWQVAEAEIPGMAETVKTECLAIERDGAFEIAWRKGDPKITAQTNQFAKDFAGQPFTIREAFQEVGFDFLDANTNFTVARERLLAAFTPNPVTRTPRFRVHRTRCAKTAHAFTRFTWYETKTITGKDQPGRRYSDFPACARYLAMDDPTWSGLQRLQHPVPLSLRAPGAGRNRVVGW
jgi:hypothetical protein